MSLQVRVWILMFNCNMVDACGTRPGIAFVAWTSDYEVCMAPWA